MFTTTKIDRFFTFYNLLFCRFVNIICWMRRFVVRSRTKIHVFLTKPTVEEKKDAQKLLWSLIPLESFDNVKQTIKDLIVITDQDELIQIKTS